MCLFMLPLWETFNGLCINQVLAIWCVGTHLLPVFSKTQTHIHTAPAPHHKMFYLVNFMCTLSSHLWIGNHITKTDLSSVSRRVRPPACPPATSPACPAAYARPPATSTSGRLHHTLVRSVLESHPPPHPLATAVASLVHCCHHLGVYPVIHREAAAQPQTRQGSLREGSIATAIN